MEERFLDDEMLIAKAQAGDYASLNALIRKHETRAYHYAYRLTRDQDEAADVVAEGFLRVYNALNNFKGQSAFTTWLYRILTNCYLDIRKKEKSRPSVSLEAAMPTADGEVERQVEDPGPTPDRCLERTERERNVERAVHQLPEIQRAMIVMYHSESMSYEEIAASLDLPIGTVKSRLNRARLNLRELLMKDEELFRL